MRRAMQREGRGQEEVGEVLIEKMRGVWAAADEGKRRDLEGERRSGPRY